ncbi:4'-phosphopantetheinyl transferase family protein [Variovorax boronicumulans]|uniref:4'-phosphopantetheinyl transferase family protein n=1 Tax=Variovorax boronicumulans TaxID=436515 RepID=UPI003394DBD2
MFGAISSAAPEAVLNRAWNGEGAWSDLYVDLCSAFFPGPQRCPMQVSCVALPIDVLPVPLPNVLLAVLPDDVRRSVPIRQRSFVAGRLCARHALAQAGHAAAATIGRHQSGEPVWPRGWCGAIAHTAEVAYAAVAPRERWRGIGIDAELVVDDTLVWPIRHMCMREPEWRLLDGCGSDEFRATLMFSAKESIYKAAAPLVGHFFDFMEAELIASDWADRRLDFRARPGGDLARVVQTCSTYFGLEGAVVHSVTTLPGLPEAAS